MIIIVLCEVKNRSGATEKVASHGIDTITGRQIVLPSEKPQDLGAVFNAEMNEWVIYGS